MYMPKKDVPPTRTSVFSILFFKCINVLVIRPKNWIRDATILNGYQVQKWRFCLYHFWIIAKWWLYTSVLYRISITHIVGWSWKRRHGLPSWKKMASTVDNTENALDYLRISANTAIQREYWHFLVHWVNHYVVSFDPLCSSNWCASSLDYCLHYTYSQ